MITYPTFPTLSMALPSPSVSQAKHSNRPLHRLAKTTTFRNKDRSELAIDPALADQATIFECASDRRSESMRR